MTTEEEATPQTPREITAAAKEESRRAMATLRNLVEDSDVSRRDIAARLGVTPAHLGRILSSRVEPRWRHVGVFPEILAMPPYDLFLELFPPRRKRRKAPSVSLRVSRQALEIYGYALESILDLQTRLDRCETVIEAAARWLRKDDAETD